MTSQSNTKNISHFIQFNMTRSAVRVKYPLPWMLDQTDHGQIVEQYSFYQHQNHLTKPAAFSDIKGQFMRHKKFKHCYASAIIQLI